jgi:hypothetical protein
MGRGRTNATRRVDFADGVSASQQIQRIAGVHDMSTFQSLAGFSARQSANTDLYEKRAASRRPGFIEIRRHPCCFHQFWLRAKPAAAREACPMLSA